ncbi:MAG: lactate utilization protein [Syntrophales bacterium]|jgi:L-lactate dehydrogenase complex protein LldG|nr:lactate utilization protein [Syntrophales bacterium]MDY0045104.1 lactate utilization protein [Syntrophales bacterium]
MTENAREEILGKLKKAQRPQVSPRPHLPPARELAYNREEMIARFTEELILQEAKVFREEAGTVPDRLAEIASAERVKHLIVSTDDVVARFDLPAWGKARGIEIHVPQDFSDRSAFKDAVFETDAGITGADFAVAESGTLGIIHDKDQPRLLSLAPIMHIAIVPVERLYPTYEEVMKEVYGDNKNIPPHFTFITGPSMTADIKATPFKGMHGPRRLIVILLG